MLVLMAVMLTAGCADSTPQTAVRVVVPSGATFRAAADSLARAGLIRSSRLFGLYAKLTDRDRALKPGTYLIEAGRSWASILDDLTEGRGLVVTLTIPEGWSLAEIVPLLAQRLEVPIDSVEAAVRDTALLARLGVPMPTLEGYLFPETYTFSPGTTARSAVGETTREFERRWRPEWTARLDSLGLTRHQVVTLASIVEKEARVAEERPIIAAVYSNRLRRGMLLQADPTVQYSLGEHVDRVLYKHLETDSPYNTYRYPGLPPGPIASPGEASLEAAVHPADVPYLYFVARADGRHEFRVTFAEHEQAISRIRREDRQEREAAGADSVRGTGRKSPADQSARR